MRVIALSRTALLFIAFATAHADEAAGPHYVPYQADSSYRLDETVGCM
jgi:hypothetical protein